MVVREKYEQELTRVQQRLVDLCELAIHAFDRSVDGLLQKDVEKAWVLIDQDRFINRLEQHIQDDVLLLIAKQQPVATDLRRVMVIVKAASEMERIGDYAVNIAKETIRLGETELTLPIEKIDRMRGLAVKMLRDMLQLFITENLLEAKVLAEMDDQIDALYGEALTELLEATHTQTGAESQLQQLSFVCKYIERAADHATNLAESLFYLVKGKHYAFD
ncbi:PhoU family transcriptional regulator [Kurthia sp. 3B1D]|uniref:Phosphate-specific transport system accessory protein PhoU n=2 Tax=Candidatus Kurthia intestinigallinarum TaxID=1562256 RepID=A0A433RVS9_9BACL|nr:phosphate signaling complex protein PhoU [Kurthia sp. 3B1D]RUS57378.1 PhoU family transcriptional regulator [Kurthia sp. 3B1D]